MLKKNEKREIRKLSATDGPILAEILGQSILASYEAFLSKQQMNMIKNDLSNLKTYFPEAINHARGIFLENTCRGFMMTQNKRLRGLYIHPEYFGRGLGSILLKEGLDIIGDRGWLICRAGNEKAHIFYRKNGLKDCGIQPDDTRGGIFHIDMPNRLFTWGNWENEKP